jgi:hypothetical protein
LAAPDEPVVSTDALTGVQALERTPPGLPRAPGTVERREFESIRHGPWAGILSRNVVTGQLGAPACGPPRPAADGLAHGQAGVAREAGVTRWHFVVDTRDSHRAAALGRYVATESTLELDLGEKGTRGILATRQSRAALLSDPRHRRVFHYTPKQTSWMNQIESCLSILVRTRLKRGSFTSVADLKGTLLAFV